MTSRSIELMETGLYKSSHLNKSMISLNHLGGSNNATPKMRNIDGSLTLQHIPHDTQSLLNSFAYLFLGSASLGVTIGLILADEMKKIQRSQQQQSANRLLAVGVSDSAEPAQMSQAGANECFVLSKYFQTEVVIVSAMQKTTGSTMKFGSGGNYKYRVYLMQLAPLICEPIVFQAGNEVFKQFRCDDEALFNDAKAFAFICTELSSIIVQNTSSLLEDGIVRTSSTATLFNSADSVRNKRFKRICGLDREDFCQVAIIALITSAAIGLILLLTSLLDPNTRVTF
ncbi:hypothetical protein MIR68_002828 [Amoeboaphelidium protococcarum]|nr:hypothetical protein MIR68_002828 [Amoeboaphelidium protococcarum]